jgi:steroid 5-alpha reductase family enzyme
MTCPAMTNNTSLFHQLYLCGKLGAQLHPVESLVGYCLFLPYIYSNEDVQQWLIQNALVQLLIFVPVAFLPAWVTHKMFYVDIAWPAGVMAIGIQILLWSSSSPAASSGGSSLGIPQRLIGIALSVHGGRMCFGALAIFFPYVFPKDIPRYQYAKLRFIQEGGLPSFWMVKLTHDIFQQYFANAVILGAIGALATADRTTQISPMQVFGLIIWVSAFAFENMADVQKIRFDREVRKLNKTAEKKKYYVLGQAPFDGPDYSVWTLCRHPNYFGEWMAWIGLIISVMPCVFHTIPNSSIGLMEPHYQTLLQVSGWVLCLAFIPRFFYDCLLYWTGAAPAEHFSHQKRGQLYEEYQRSTRVFFPFPAPLVNHAQAPGWSTLKNDAKRV